VHALAIGEPPLLSMAEMTQVIQQMQLMRRGKAPDLNDVRDTPRLRRAG
jgi:L-fuculose-phosphate aldolase